MLLTSYIIADGFLKQCNLYFNMANEVYVVSFLLNL